MHAEYSKVAQKIANFTGAPYVVLTDCCTHAIELCMRLKQPQWVEFSAYTYLSVLMTMHKLNIQYTLTDETWQGEYKFHGTNIWDSARLVAPNMHRTGQMQCLSFGYSKPVCAYRGGAILLDNSDDYCMLVKMAYDGRDLSISPWVRQQTFAVGYHYRPTLEEVRAIGCAFDAYIAAGDYAVKSAVYPDTRTITIQ